VVLAIIQEVRYVTRDKRNLLAALRAGYPQEVQLPELPGWVILRRAGTDVTTGPVTARPVP